MENGIVNKLLNNGVRKDTPYDLRSKLRIFNSAIFICFIINLFYGVVGYVNGYFMAFWVTMVLLALCVLSYVILAKGKYNLAFHITLWLTIVFLSAMTYLFGGANSAYYFFLFVPVAAVIVFDKPAMTIFYFLISTGVLILNIYYVKIFPPYYGILDWMGNFSYLNVFFASMLIYMGVRMFKSNNIKYANTIETQNKSLEEKNQEITDSINYAKKIQSALIPLEEEFNSHFKESFVILKPKDIVSGDFYWITKKHGYIFYATGDCTGHGVPGGFMTMLGISFLDEIINEKNIVEPAEILNALRDRIIHTLKQTGNSGESKDGMDIVMCRLDSKNALTYSAANNSMYVFGKAAGQVSGSNVSSNAQTESREMVLTEYKPDKRSKIFHSAYYSTLSRRLCLYIHRWPGRSVWRTKRKEIQIQTIGKPGSFYSA
jgi:phosphoserine phosphatase RsbU/P